MFEQILAHLIGDYVIQTDHMADRKVKSLPVAFWHACIYALPFLFLTRSYGPLLVIIGTHAVIDRYRLAKYVVWVKNQLAPAAYRYPFSKAAWHGYQEEKPVWIAGWLFIIADNCCHLILNYLALRYLA